MTRTLKMYLGWDLVKATAMATVAFTLVITVFAVIEPLREEGLSSGQALRLFGYIMPVMFSLTLPVAGLFAATIVYGRFSRDNELMACRASGICPLSLLGPAIWLGAIVSAVTLILGLYVAPNLLYASERTINKNLRQMVYSRLQKTGYFDSSGWIFHADQVDPESGWVRGAVGVVFSEPGNAKSLVAASAKLEFLDRDGRTFVKFHPTNPALIQQAQGNMGMADEIEFRLGNLPSFKDKPKLYDWTRLCRTLANPAESRIVQKEIDQIRRRVCIRKLHEDVVDRIGADGVYDRLVGLEANTGGAQAGRVRIEANQADLLDGHVVLTAALASPSAGAGAGAGAEKNAVTVLQYDGERLKRRLSAGRVSLKGLWDEFRSMVLVTVTLEDVTILDEGGNPEDAYRKKEYELGPFAMPADIAAQGQGIDLGQLYSNPGMCDSPRIQKKIARIIDKVVPNLLRKITAEMHQRLAYGISCLLMVMLGAALGLIFRGGEVLVAFAISAVPAAAVIVVMWMGKQLITNTGISSAWYGIAVIWGGVGALAATTAYLYVVHMRR